MGLKDYYRNFSLGKNKRIKSDQNGIERYPQYFFRRYTLQG